MLSVVEASSRNHEVLPLHSTAQRPAEPVMLSVVEASSRNHEALPLHPAPQRSFRSPRGCLPTPSRLLPTRPIRDRSPRTPLISLFSALRSTSQFHSTSARCFLQTKSKTCNFSICLPKRRAKLAARPHLHARNSMKKRIAFPRKLLFFGRAGATAGLCPAPAQGTSPLRIPFRCRVWAVNLRFFPKHRLKTAPRRRRAVSFVHCPARNAPQEPSRDHRGVGSVSPARQQFAAGHAC